METFKLNKIPYMTNIPYISQQSPIRHIKLSEVLTEYNDGRNL